MYTHNTFWKISILGALFGLMLSTGSAQHVGAPWGAGLGMVYRNFDQIPNGEYENLDFRGGFQLKVGRYLNPSFDAIINAGIVPYSFGERDKEELTDVDLNIRYKLNNGYLFKERSFIAPYLSVGFGVNFQEEFAKTVNPSIPLGLGFRFNFGDHLSFDLGGKYHLDMGEFQDYVGLSAGVNVNLGKGKEEFVPPPPPVVPPDSDKDGIADAEDACPFVAGPASLMGCPDQDQDGLADKDDDCPEEFGPKERNGCPLVDSDQDGVEDENDACPNEAGLAALDGCPDSDGDGIRDMDDECPEDAGLADFGGCPDTDQDGIADPNDKCPEEPGLESLQGCPEVSQEVVEKLELVKKAVRFELGSSTLKTESYAVLDTVVKIMNDHPAYYLRITGHTDNIGNERTNQLLSERRAKACRDYLLSKGIDNGRIAYSGYGESQPIASNATPAGRALNRRVEFELYAPPSLELSKEQKN